MNQPKTHLRNIYRTPFQERSRRDFLRLDMNENPDGLPDEFVREVLKCIDANSLSMYPEYTSLITKIADHNNVGSENICIANGSDGAIKYIFDAYVAPGDHVLLTAPTFAMYPVYCEMFDARSVFVPYRDDFSFPLNQFLESICEDIRLAVLVNPNNPTGVAISRSDFLKVISRCCDNDVMCIVDEAYFYYYDETFIQDIKTFENLIVLRTFSKVCSLAGARVGYAAASPEITLNLNKVRPTYDVNGFAALFAERILDAPQLVAQAIENAREGKDFLVNQLRQNNIECVAGMANFVLIKCPGLVGKLVDELRKEKILVSGGFKQHFLKDYLRVTVGSLSKMTHFFDVFFCTVAKIYRNKFEGFMIRRILVVLKKGLRIFGIDPGKVLQYVRRWSLVKAVEMQGLSDMMVRLRKIVPDISQQEFTESLSFNDYAELKRRALQAFQCELMLETTEFLDKEKISVVDIGDSAGTHMLYLKNLLGKAFDLEALSVNLDPRAIEKIKALGGGCALEKSRGNPT